MNCRLAKKWLIRGTDHLTPEEMHRLDAHLKACFRCKEKAESTQMLEQSIQTFRKDSVPDEIIENFDIQVMAQLERIRHSPGIRRSRVVARQPRWAWAIPAISIVFVISILIGTRTWRDNRSPEASLLTDTAIHSAQIDGKDAQISIFEINDPQMTFIWLESPNSENGG